jgi:hypothetical protein
MLSLEHIALISCLLSIVLLQRGAWLESLLCSVGSMWCSAESRRRQRALSERED